MALTLEDLKAAASKGLPVEKCSVDGLGDVYLRGLTALERDQWETSVAEAKNAREDELRKVNMMVTDINFRGSLVAYALCDETGKPLIAVPNGPDALAIAKLPAKYVCQMYDVAARLCGVSKDDTAQLEKKEPIAGGSSTA